MKSEPVVDRRLLAYDLRIFLLALGAGAPAMAVALYLLWTSGFSGKVQWTLTVLITGSWLGFAIAVRERIIHPLQMISNMLAALQEGDYSIRVRPPRDDDALGLVMLEVNNLGATLHKQRLDAVEATALLTKVMEEIDVAVFTFDDRKVLQLVNRGGERLLDVARDSLIGQTAEQLGLAHCLTGPSHRILEGSFGSQGGRWELRRSKFREGGLPHEMVVLSDLTRTLRQEERQAWQRLVQVLRHEINNSLAPIRSLAGTLRRIVLKDPRPSDWEEDIDRGLNIIAERSGALSRFMSSYSQLTRLPEPAKKSVDVATWVKRVADLETRLKIEVVPGPLMHVHADGDQLDQMLINLVRNAVDAVLETQGGVRVGWRTPPQQKRLDVWVQDDGPGIQNTDNLFVPFFTTKPQGSGIGLVLSRQIAEAHGGSLELRNREDGVGCEARLQLPL